MAEDTPAPKIELVPPVTPSAEDLDQVAAEETAAAQTSADPLPASSPASSAPASAASAPTGPGPSGDDPGDEHAEPETETQHDPDAAPAGSDGQQQSDLLDSSGKPKTMEDEHGQHVAIEEWQAIGPRGEKPPPDAQTAEERAVQPEKSAITDHIDSIGAPQGSFAVEDGGKTASGVKLPDKVDYSQPIEPQPTFGPRGPNAPKDTYR
jgi:hypothetical protein